MRGHMTGLLRAPFLGENSTQPRLACCQHPSGLSHARSAARCALPWFPCRSSWRARQTRRALLSWQASCRRWLTGPLSSVHPAPQHRGWPVAAAAQRPAALLQRRPAGPARRIVQPCRARSRRQAAQRVQPARLLARAGCLVLVLPALACLLWRRTRERGRRRAGSGASCTGMTKAAAACTNPQTGDAPGRCCRALALPCGLQSCGSGARAILDLQSCPPTRVQSAPITSV